ncbi:hypothetical protein ACE3MZ_07315 [Paenibacillus sp. WLX1005]|uniref:hypothetical protein n=1 Tax=Paenibacillus sp. WLX1005 TaxID=3243766 RepID=UPI0039844701
MKTIRLFSVMMIALLLCFPVSLTSAAGSSVTPQTDPPDYGHYVWSEWFEVAEDYPEGYTNWWSTNNVVDVTVVTQLEGDSRLTVSFQEGGGSSGWHTFETHVIEQSGSYPYRFGRGPVIPADDYHTYRVLYRVDNASGPAAARGDIDIEIHNVWAGPNW